MVRGVIDSFLRMLQFSLVLTFPFSSVATTFKAAITSKGDPELVRRQTILTILIGRVVVDVKLFLFSNDNKPETSPDRVVSRTQSLSSCFSFLSLDIMFTGSPIKVMS